METAGDWAGDWPQIGARVAEARLAAGLSQGQLAERLDLDRTAVVRLESGDRKIGAVELYRLAEVLAVPMAHFLSAPVPAMISRRTALAEDASSATRTRFRLDALLEAHWRDARWLAEHAGLPAADPELARRLRLLVDDPLLMAQEARRALDARSGPIGPMASAAERFGLYLTVADLDTDGASLLDESFGVAVIGHLSPGRRRWTAARELGHHLAQDEYHSDAGVAASRDDREQQVNRFAAEFLLPRDDLASALDGTTAADLRTMLIAVAGRYRLSWSAVVGQAAAAEIINAQDAARMCSQTPVHGDFLAAMGSVPEEDLELGATGAVWRRTVLSAWKAGTITAARTTELLHGALTVDQLPEQGGVNAQARHIPTHA